VYRAGTFLLVFFFQGPYGYDPLTAGLSLIPLGITMMVVGPLSGRMSDKYGPRNLTILGLALAATALLGLASIGHSTPYWLIAVLMIALGAGLGLYSSPNNSSIMNTVPPERRGTAAGTRTMLRNTGSMLSLSLAFPLVLSGLSTQDTLNLFLYGGGMSAPALIVFENGLHEAFLLFFVVASVAMFVAMLRPRRQIVRR
jgi:MFS family permease